MIHEFLVRVKAGGDVGKFYGKKIRKVLEENEGKRVFIRIIPATSRSDAQNAYVHWLFGIASKELIELTGDTSWSPDKVKSMCKVKFLTVDVFDVRTGEVIGQEILETRNLSKEKMSEFISSVRSWFIDTFNIHLPAPHEQQHFNL